MSPTPKPPVPAWRWAAWWTVLGAAIIVFYVILTPIWIGLRLLAWAADYRARARPSTSVPSADDRKE
jgi:hypothetical protein